MLITRELSLQLYSTVSEKAPKHEFEEKPRFPGAANAHYTEKMDLLIPMMVKLSQCIESWILMETS